MTYDPIADDGVQYAIDNPEMEGRPCPCGSTTFRESNRETETMICTKCGQALHAAVPTITISLEIENTYELEEYDDETTTVTDAVMPAPPADRDSQAFEDWADEHIKPLTGTGQTRGDSWYDVEVTACSDPTLVGHEFQWGY